MLDVHLHVVPPNLPGAGPLSPLLEGRIESLVEELRRALAEADVKRALAMGCLSASPEDPLGVASTLQIAQQVPALCAVGVADPRRTDADHLQRAETVLKSGQIKALKAYLGYLHYGPDHSGYRPYYELAERYRLPVIFHTGDTYSPSARLKFAHPLLVDDVAVDHPGVRFVIAHLGNPWLLEAAEVVYKNVNVWADLSGLVVGDADSFTAEQRQDVLSDTAAALRRTFHYAERPNRFLYGSDWPLVPMTSYRDFIRGAVPEVFHDMVFDQNALMLLRLACS